MGVFAPGAVRAEFATAQGCRLGKIDPPLTDKGIAGELNTATNTTATFCPAHLRETARLQPAKEHRVLPERWR
jgi:hypothetical protein